MAFKRDGIILFVEVHMRFMTIKNEERKTNATRSWKYPY